MGGEQTGRRRLLVLGMSDLVQQLLSIHPSLSTEAWAAVTLGRHCCLSVVEGSSSNERGRHV